MTFYDRLIARLDSIGKTPYKLHYKAEIPSGRFAEWRRGDRRPTNTEIENLSKVDWLGLDYDTLMAWRARDDYSLDQLEIAVKLED